VFLAVKRNFALQYHQVTVEEKVHKDPQELKVHKDAQDLLDIRDREV
jgi:hypothetical protein